MSINVEHVHMSALMAFLQDAILGVLMDVPKSDRKSIQAFSKVWGFAMRNPQRSPDKPRGVQRCTEGYRRVQRGTEVQRGTGPNTKL